MSLPGTIEQLASEFTYERLELGVIYLSDASERDDANKLVPVNTKTYSSIN